MTGFLISVYGNMAIILNTFPLWYDFWKARKHTLIKAKGPGSSPRKFQMNGLVPLLENYRTITAATS